MYYHKFKGINKQHKYYPWTVRGGFKTVGRKICPLLIFGNSNVCSWQKNRGKSSL